VKRITYYGAPFTEAEAPNRVAALREADPARGSFTPRERPKPGKRKRVR
jgi:hypothetical protein